MTSLVVFVLALLIAAILCVKAMRAVPDRCPARPTAAEETRTA